LPDLSVVGMSPYDLSKGRTGPRAVSREQGRRQRIDENCAATGGAARGSYLNPSRSRGAVVRHLKVDLRGRDGRQRSLSRNTGAVRHGNARPQKFRGKRKTGRLCRARGQASTEQRPERIRRDGFIRIAGG